MKPAIGILFFNPKGFRFDSEGKPIGKPDSIKLPKGRIKPTDARFIFRLPILHKTAFPALLVVPREHGDFYYNLSWVNISKTEDLGQIDNIEGRDLDGFVPAGTIIADPKDWTQEAVLSAAEKMQKPLVESPEVAHILTDLQTSSGKYYREKIDTREQFVTHAKQDFFIAIRWRTWESLKTKWSDRLRDMAKHGLWEIPKGSCKADAADQLRREEKALQARVRELKKRCAVA